MSPIDLVADWCAKFGVGLPSAPTFTPEVCKLRIALLEEELLEYEVAKRTSNRVEMLDALCDLQYVLNGAVLHLGLRKIYDTLTSSVDIEGNILRGLIEQLAALLEQKHYSYPIAINLRLIQKNLMQVIEADGFGDVFDAAFMAVHENNRAKTWPHSTVLEFERAEYDKPIHRFTPCEWRPGFYIGRDARGKIIKPPGHTKVDLSEFVK